MPSRHRLVVPISLQPADKVQLEALRSRFAKLTSVTAMTASEAVRFAIAIAAVAPTDLVAHVVRAGTRVRLGRPHLPWDQYQPDDEFEREEAKRRDRLKLLKESENLQKLERRTPQQELRLREICDALNMVLLSPKQQLKET
jgi:hypothetical protein